MSGPTQRSHRAVRVESGEAQVLYNPTQLAFRLLNLELTPEGTLRAARGLCSYEPYRGGNQYESTGSIPSGYELFDRIEAFDEAPTIHGVFHAGLLGGQAPTLVVRAGTKMYLHAGWRRAWKEVYSGLTDDGRVGFPDMFTVVNDKVIWSNGVDQPLVIAHDGMVTPLGYTTAPGAPLVDGPQQPADKERNYPNSDGYSWPGRIGSVGDYVDQKEGAVLAGRWTYYLAWEDIHGNRSPLSPPSVEIALALQRANEDIGIFNSKYDPSSTSFIPLLKNFGGEVKTAKVDELLRQTLVRSDGSAPSHTLSCLLYRTPDKNRSDGEPRLVEKIAGTVPFAYADNVPDSRLGAKAVDVLPVPRVDVQVSHAGSLVVASGARVLRSEPGYPGTFPRDSEVRPDPDGAVVTALASHAGRLIAFTERAMVDITDPNAPPVVMARGVGCVAPRSVQGMPDGTLIWLSREAFYAWHPQKGVAKISDPIHRLVKNGLAKGAMRRAVSVIDPESREYRCAVTPAGSFKQSLVLGFNLEGWREYDFGYDIVDMCSTDDSRYQVLVAAGVEAKTRADIDAAFVDLVPGAKTTIQNLTASDLEVTSTQPRLLYDILVQGHETIATPRPVKTYEYRSAWLRTDETALRPFHVHHLYVGLIDEEDNEILVDVYSNNSFSSVRDSDQFVKAVSVAAREDGNLLGALVLGTGVVQERRISWRRVTINLENVHTWAFSLRSENPFHIYAFAMEVSDATAGQPLARIPLGRD